jgi:hypothetical protein
MSMHIRTDDISKFIKERVALPSQKLEYTNKVRSQIESILGDKAEGPFLWIGLSL